MANGMGFLDYAEAARLLGLSPYTLRRYVSGRRLPHRKIGKRVFFDPEELRSWVESHRVGVQKGRTHG